jgi:hypothetical protein
MDGATRELPVDLDMPVPDREGAERLGLDLAETLRDKVARERETIRVLCDYLRGAQDLQRAG